jgi:uncharacterized membrane-anchored protein
MRPLLTALLCLTLGTPLLTSAAAPAEAPAAGEKITVEQFLAGLQFKQGKITLADNIATLDLPPNFRYLGPDDTNKILVDGWGNPPGAKTLGMILPADVNPLSAAGWGVIITYDKDGHVKDDDADKHQLCRPAQGYAGRHDREQQGAQGAGLSGHDDGGWAEQPSYDKAQHKLYWAKELQTEGSNENGLNYNIRVLGREGVLVLNAVSGMDQIAQVKTEMKNVTAFTEFTPATATPTSTADRQGGRVRHRRAGRRRRRRQAGPLRQDLRAAAGVQEIHPDRRGPRGSWVYKLFGRKKEEKAAGQST